MKSINAGKLVALGGIFAITFAAAGCSTGHGYSNYDGYNGNYSNSAYPYDNGGYRHDYSPTYVYREQPAVVTVYRTQPATVNVYHDRDNDAYRDRATATTAKPYVHSDYDHARAAAPVAHENHARGNERASDESVHAKTNDYRDHGTTTHHEASTERTEQD